MELNKLAEEIYEANKAKGFWDNPVELGTRLMLVVSELGEAIEAHRNGKIARTNSYKTALSQTAIVAFKSDEAEEESKASNFKYYIKDSFEDELADALIRILDMCGGMGIDIDFHVKEKLWYNSTRAHKHGKSY